MVFYSWLPILQRTKFTFDFWDAQCKIMGRCATWVRSLKSYLNLFGPVLIKHLSLTKANLKLRVWTHTYLNRFYTWSSRTFFKFMKYKAQLGLKERERERERERIENWQGPKASLSVRFNVAISSDSSPKCVYLFSKYWPPSHTRGGSERQNESAKMALLQRAEIGIRLRG